MKEAVGKLESKIAPEMEEASIKSCLQWVKFLVHLPKRDKLSKICFILPKKICLFRQ